MGMKKREAGEGRGIFSMKEKKYQRVRVFWLPGRCPSSPTSKTLALFYSFFEFSHE